MQMRTALIATCIVILLVGCDDGAAERTRKAAEQAAREAAARDRAMSSQLVGKWHLVDRDTNLGFEGSKEYIVLNAYGGFVFWPEVCGTGGMIMPVLETFGGKAETIGRWNVQNGSFVAILDSVNHDKGEIKAGTTLTNPIFTVGPDYAKIGGIWGSMHREMSSR